jgi:O-antigen/teichoic acid export membrane protein
MIGFIYFYFKEKKSIFLWKFDFKLAKKLLKNSWPLILSGIVVTIYMKIDQIMIKEMLGVKEVGKYAAAVTLSESWYFIPVIICNSLFPAIVNAKKVGETLYYERLQKLYNLMTWLSLSIAIFFTFFSKFIVNLLYGKEYMEAANVLTIHIWAGVFVFLGMASGKWLISENLQKYTAINTTIGAIINVILNYILIEKIGIKGAAISTLISYFFSAYFSLLFFKKTRKNFIRISKSLITFGFFNNKEKCG